MQFLWTPDDIRANLSKQVTHVNRWTMRSSTEKKRKNAEQRQSAVTDWETHWAEFLIPCDRSRAALLNVLYANGCCWEGGGLNTQHCLFLCKTQDKVLTSSLQTKALSSFTHSSVKWLTEKDIWKRGVLCKCLIFSRRHETNTPFLAYPSCKSWLSDNVSVIMATMTSDIMSLNCPV